MAMMIIANCDTRFYVGYTCTPEFNTIYSIIIYSMVFTMFTWIGIGLYSLAKFIRTRKITKTSN